MTRISADSNNNNNNTEREVILTLFAVRREKELKQLYEKIAREFPFVAKQGLKPGQKVS